MFRTTLAVAIIMIASSSVSRADDASNWKALEKVMTELQSSNDPSTFSYLVGRCTGLYVAIAKSSQSRAKSAEVGAQYLDFASKLLRVLSLANLQISGLTPSEENLNIQMTSDTETITTFANGYIDRMNYNYTTTGHTLAEDPFMRQETMICKTVAETVLQ